jgi:hypothetical protein
MKTIKKKNIYIKFLNQKNFLITNYIENKKITNNNFNLILTEFGINVKEQLENEHVNKLPEFFLKENTFENLNLYSIGKINFYFFKK